MSERTYQLLQGLEDDEVVLMKIYHYQVMTTEQRHMRLAYLEREIAEYPCWGAALTAMDEEARGLRRLEKS